MMRMYKLLNRLSRRRRKDNGPSVRVSSLLYADAAEPLVLPLIPVALAHAGDAATNIEFAAATVLDRVGLAALVKRHQPQRIFEIGTFRGVTATTMAANAPSGSVLYTLDLPPHLSAGEIAGTHYAGNTKSGFHKLAGAHAARDVGRLIGTHSGPGRIEQLFGDSTTFDFSAFENSIDLFFVDGCHTYANAIADTRAAWRCLKPGGLIVWHDYPWPDVERAVADAKIGPVTAIADTNLAYASKPHLLEAIADSIAVSG